MLWQVSNSTACVWVKSLAEATFEYPKFGLTPRLGACDTCVREPSGFLVIIQHPTIDIKIGSYLPPGNGHVYHVVIIYIYNIYIYKREFSFIDSIREFTIPICSIFAEYLAIKLTSGANVLFG